MRMDDPLVLPHLPETVMSPPAAMFFSARSVLGPSGLAYLSFTRSAHAIISFTTQPVVENVSLFRRIERVDPAIFAFNLLRGQEG